MALTGSWRNSWCALARAMKDTQMEGMHCYHCSSLEHFICNCPLVKALGVKSHFKLQGGDGTKEGSPNPSNKSDHTEGSHRSGAKGIEKCVQTPFLNPDPFQHWYGAKNVAKVKINRQSCMALLNNGVQINTIAPSYHNAQLCEESFTGGGADYSPN